MGLDQSYSPCSYQLVLLVNILAWDCLIKLVGGPEGQRGRVPRLRADDRHSLRSERERQIPVASCGCLPRLGSVGDGPWTTNWDPLAHLVLQVLSRSKQADRPAHHVRLMILRGLAVLAY